MKNDYTPHSAQSAIHAAASRRFRVVCTGRRFGKTLLLAAELLERGSAHGGEYGWVAPTYNVAERGVEAFRSLGGGIVSVSGRAPCKAEFQGRKAPMPARVWFLSADNADAIRGYGFRGLVVDEAAMIPADVWNYVLRPTIAQTLGWAVLASTPKGRNWFYDLFARGLDPAEKDYASFSFPSSASPFFPPEEWEEARRTLPEDVFRQEYMAEFLEDSAGVFRGVDACTVPDLDKSVESHRNVVVGCDVAKHTDWTVLVAMDAQTGRCFALERFNQLDWPVQKDRIVAFSRRWGGRVILDATGVGDPVHDELKRALPDIEAVVLTLGSKVDLVQRLAVAIAQRQVSWPRGGDWDTLVSELKRYEYDIGPSGRVSYRAPSGHCDDCVVALALANHGRWKQGTAGTMARLCVGDPRWGWHPSRGWGGRRRERASQGV